MQGKQAGSAVAKHLSLVRMSGRRTGFHFAWTCSAPLAAGICRSTRRSPSIGSPQKGGARFRAPKARERVLAPIRGSGAPSGAMILRRLLRRAAPACEAGSPYGAPPGVIRWWDPSAPAACRSSLGSGHLTRRRDGRFHPGLPCEPGGLLHTSPGDRLARPVRGSPPPFTLSLALQSAPQRMGDTSAIRMGPDTVQRKNSALDIIQLSC